MSVIVILRSWKSVHSLYPKFVFYSFLACVVAFPDVYLKSVILLKNCFRYSCFLSVIRHMKMSYTFLNICIVMILGLDHSWDCDPFLVWWSAYSPSIPYPPIRIDKSPSFLCIDGDQYCNLELLHVHASLNIISDWKIISVLVWISH